MDLNLIATGTATCASQDQMSIANVNCFNGFAFHTYLFYETNSNFLNICRPCLVTFNIQKLELPMRAVKKAVT